MEALKLVLFSLAFLCAGLAVADDVVVDPHAPPTISTERPTKHSSVTEHHTTAHAISTHPSVSTETHASPTTASPTTAAPTTTAKPTPTNVWAVENNNGTYCILLQATFTMTFSYNSTENKIVTNKTAINKPPNPDVKASGNCLSDVEQSISLSFLKDWVLTLNFTHENNSALYSVTHFELQYNLAQANFSNLPSNLTESVTESYPVNKKFETSKAGYSCMANQTLYTRAAGGNDTLVRIDVQELKLEAFQKKAKADFESDSLYRCSQDEISNLVPIIVGACLGGLILIVLVAYLIGRRRSRRGYESV